MRTDQAYPTHSDEVVLAVSLELAANKWKIALHDGRREQPTVHTVAQPQAAARLHAVLDLIEAQKKKWSLPADIRIVVSYEAGQDAFWIYRALQARGVDCYVVDPASIPVERHKRRAKTDRLDAIKLVINLRRMAARRAGSHARSSRAVAPGRSVTPTDARSRSIAKRSAAAPRPDAQTASHPWLLGQR